MPLSLRTREVGGVVVVDAEGRINLGEGSDIFRDKIRDLIKQGKKRILLNMADVSYTDSTGICALVSAFTCAANSGGELKILALQKKVEDLLRITKLYTVFEVYDDEKAAVESFKFRFTRGSHTEFLGFFILNSKILEE